MPLTHLLIALGVVAIWGSNFVVIKLGLAEWPPLLFVALRFLVSALPALFLPYPPAPWFLLAAYGLLIGVGQFSVLFYAMQADITPGLASLIIQMQAFFTVGLAWLFYGEPMRRTHVAGLLLAACGIAVIGWQSGAFASGADETGHPVTVLGIGLVLFAAASWSTANIVTKRIGRMDVLPFIAWSSLYPALAVLALSFAIEGPHKIGTALAAAGAGGWAAVLWQAIANTIIGYGAWTWLLTRHPAMAVAPLALLVPVFGMGASAVALGEPLPLWKLAAATMVIGGLALTVLGGRLAKA